MLDLVIKRGFKVLFGVKLRKSWFLFGEVDVVLIFVFFIRVNSFACFIKEIEFKVWDDMEFCLLDLDY